MFVSRGRSDGSRGRVHVHSWARTSFSGLPIFGGHGGVGASQGPTAAKNLHTTAVHADLKQDRCAPVRSTAAAPVRRRAMGGVPAVS
eukprot:2187875-Pyramimonas_sp.AAC.1